MSELSIGLIGDYNPNVKAHIAIPKALKLVSEEIQINIDSHWLPTESLIENHQMLLSSFNGLWCVPASPYKSMEGALNGIRFARENKIPFLGTCGGFQHTVIEYVRDVLGMSNASHAETNPEAEFKIISPLSCSLVEKKGGIRFKEGSKIAGIYNSAEAIEEYHCNYGINPEYKEIFTDGDIVITGFDMEGEPRVIEISSHPFFIATLYQPERLALSGKIHPLIKAFCYSSLNHYKNQ
jgi:CTP synthase (UTP-ammonia lyase)